MSAIILDENKKYIAAIFNILGENKNIPDENKLSERSVGRFSAQRQLSERGARRKNKFQTLQPIAKLKF